MLAARTGSSPVMVGRAAEPARPRVGVGLVRDPAAG
jgi:hypothetical protein